MSHRSTFAIFSVHKAQWKLCQFDFARHPIFANEAGGVAYDLKMKRKTYCVWYYDIYKDIYIYICFIVPKCNVWREIIIFYPAEKKYIHIINTPSMIYESFIIVIAECTTSQTHFDTYENIIW